MVQVNSTLDTAAGASKKVVCAQCGQPLQNGESHSVHDYKELKLRLDGYLQPGQKLYRNILLDMMHASIPKDPEVRVQIYNYEIAPKAFTNWHVHMGAQFFITLQGEFEGHFEEGVLIKGKAGEVYSEPIGKVHRGHNPNPEVSLLGVGIALTGLGLDHVLNVEPPNWAPKTDPVATART